MEVAMLFLHNMKLVLFPPFWAWWVGFWLVLPLFAAMAAWLAVRYRRLNDGDKAWNACGRRWRAIGWALLSAVAAAYVLGALGVPATWITQWALGNETAQTGFRMYTKTYTILVPFVPQTPIEKTTVFMAFNKQWFCGILPALAWVLFAWLFFIIPGGRIANEKPGIR